MAYIIKLSKKCYNQHCPKQATYRLYNTRNGEMGDYCTKRAKEREKQLQDSEKRNVY